MHRKSKEDIYGRADKNAKIDLRHFENSGHSFRSDRYIFKLARRILYAIYAGIGYVQNWQFAEGYHYPYFFLNWCSPAGAFGFTDELPYMGCAWWILTLFCALLIVGMLYLLILDGLKKRL